MKRLAFLLILLSIVSAQTVRGYYRKSGTYVAPYYRTKADGYTYNNYSYKPKYRYKTSYSTKKYKYSY